jgi:hypothetical protein
MPEDQAWRRRQALQLAAQLPDNTDDALAIVDLTRKLVVSWLCADQARAPLEPVTGEVVEFPASASSR